MMTIYNSFEEFELAVSGMTDSDMIEWITNLYVNRLESTRHTMEIKKSRNSKQVTFEKIYTYF